MRRLSCLGSLIWLSAGCAVTIEDEVGASSSGAFEGCVVTKVISEGARVHSANGLAIDLDGRLLVASLTGDEIVVMDRRTGEILDRWQPPVALGPDDVVVTPDGSIYWTSLMTGYVGRRSATGVFSQQFVAPGVNPITYTYADDGGLRIFVGLDFFGDGLYEIDPELVDPPRAIIRYEPGHYPLGFINGFDFGPDGRLYGPLWTQEMVVSIDVDSCDDTLSPWIDCDIQVVAQLSAHRVEPGLRVVPSAAAFDSSARLHVTTTSGQVLRISETGTPELLVRLPFAIDNLVFDADDVLYVSSYDEGAVARIVDGDVEYISPGGFIAPGGVAVVEHSRGTDSVFVADFWTLRELSPASGRQSSAASAGLAIPELPLQPATSASADGELLVLTSLLSRTVQVWDHESRAAVETHVTPGIPFDAVRFDDALAVSVLDATTFESRVVSIDATGAVQTIFESPYLYYALGLAASDDVLFVSDWATGLVWRFDSGAASAVPIAAGLANPEGLALDGAGGLLVVESGTQRLSRIDLTTGAVTTVVEELALGFVGRPPLHVPHGGMNGVAVAPSGTIFVTGDLANVLYRIEAATNAAECRHR